MLRRIAVFSVMGILCFSMSGCLIIGAKDGDVRDRVSVVESRLDNLERLYAGAPPSQQYGQTEDFASTAQIAEARVGNRTAPR